MCAPVAVYRYKYTRKPKLLLPPNNWHSLLLLSLHGFNDGDE